MKIADLNNEHGLKSFRGANIIFGLFWGIFGASLVIYDAAIANIILAMNLAFVIRMRLDYFNHSLAASIIIITFFLFREVELSIMLPFYCAFVIFGGIKDIRDDVLKERSILGTISESMWYYPISGLAYSVITTDYKVFFVLTAYTASYNITKYYFAKFREVK